MNVRDRWVRFKVCDIYHPDLTRVLIDLHGNDLLLGKVIALSDAGLQKEAFAVVEVEGIEELLIVPVERMLSSL
jgi:hypothetical protein